MSPGGASAPVGDGPRGGEPRSSVAFRAIALSAALLATGCVDGSPADPGSHSGIEVAALAGDGQFGLPGDTLEPFEVLVRNPDDLKPRSGVRVEWKVVEGSGGSLDRSTTHTDGAGRARARLTLGPTPDGYRVRARFPEHGVEDVEFRARAVVRPELTAVGDGVVVPDSVVVLEGAHFVPETDAIDVLFSGIRARVLSGDETSLRVRVPGCLVEARVSVTVSLGPVRSGPLDVDVERPGTPALLAPGDVRRVDDPSALSCLLLSGGSEREYLAVVHSASTVGSALHDYSLVLRAPGEAVTVAGIPPESGDRHGIADFPVSWELKLRRREMEAASGRGRDGAPRVRTSGRPSAVPSPGERRRFRVLDGSGGFSDVEAEARFVGEWAVVYVDVDAPEGGFADDDLRMLAEEFDDTIHPTVTGAFGEESDLDGNGRVVILFTPVVNELTDPGSDGFVGGFFYGVDLLPDQAGSNGAEIFYALVPDPEGEFGDPRSRAEVLARVPGILAHEFQHMVHFNERVLIRGAERTDALWLSEALATTAEELVAEALSERGADGRAQLFRSSNRLRARRFLGETAETSLVVTQGSGSLAERGAGWLFMAYLRDRRGDGVLGELTRTTRTGTRNVETVVEAEWADLLDPWTVALYVDAFDTPVPEPYRYGSLDLRDELGGAEYPLQPPVLGRSDATVVAELRSSAAAFTILAPQEEPGLSLNLAGPSGGALAEASALAMTVVRLR